MQFIVGIDFGVDSVKTSLVRFNDSKIELIRLKRVSPYLFDIKTLITRNTKYIATTGIEFPVNWNRYGYFHSLTASAYGAHFLAPQVRTILNIGARFSSVARVDEHGRVKDHIISSPCNSANGSFLRNICWALGISLSKADSLYRKPRREIRISTVCPVMAETDIINLICKGWDISDLIGVTYKMLAKKNAVLLKRIKATSPVMVVSGIARSKILLDLIEEETCLKIVRHKNSFYASSIGAAFLGAHRVGIKHVAS